MREIREILFRGKCCTTGEWVEGFLGIEVPDDYVIQQFSFDEYFASECIDQYSVKLETVGQYTGLTDKNDKKIFEGDIIFDPEMKENHIVMFDEGGFCTEEMFLQSYLCFDEMEVEVIGNIHDNPELLEVAEND